MQLFVFLPILCGQREALARANHICMPLQDGAYAVWQRMLKLGVVPDEVTQRLLASCFGGNLLMASAIVKEARQLQVGCHSGFGSYT